jgi:hypothetical protein
MLWYRVCSFNRVQCGIILIGIEYIDVFILYILLDTHARKWYRARIQSQSGRQH